MAKLSDLKNRSKNSLDRLTQEIEKMKAPARSNRDDDRFWSPTVDQSGNGRAVIRFLPEPAADGDNATPWVRVFSHGFQGPTGSWYIENSLTTIGQNDPVSDYNSKLWNSGIESDKNIARDQKRRLHYISNILVVEDPGNPENEGKTFLYKYGTKIFDKVQEAMHPEFEDETAFNPFNIWEGADFNLRIRKVAGYRNYDKSGFSKPAPLSMDDAEIEKMWNNLPSLQEFLDPKNFKSYDELLSQLNRVVGFDTRGGDTSATPKAKVKESQTVPESESPPFDIETDSDDGELSDYFQSLADAD